MVILIENKDVLADLLEVKPDDILDVSWVMGYDKWLVKLPDEVETEVTGQAIFQYAQLYEVAKKQLEFYNKHLNKDVVTGEERIEPPPSEYQWRCHSLKPGYKFGPVIQHGTGWYVYREDTGEVCEHTLRWFLQGQVLLCTTCHFEGT